LRIHRTTGELREIVAAASPAYTPRLVALATRELALRCSTEEQAFERKVILSATAAAIVGAICVVWPILLLSLFRTFAPGSTSPATSMPFPFSHFARIFTGVAVFQVFEGLLLFAGGMATRSRSPIGPRLVSAALLLGLAYIVVFSVVFIPSVSAFPVSGPFNVVFVAFALFNSAFWGFLLWLPFRLFSSRRVRAFCSGAAA